MQRDLQANPISSDNLNSLFNNSDDASSVFGDVSIGGKDDTTKMSDNTQDIAYQTTQELELAINQQRGAVNSIESQINNVTVAAQSG